MHPETSVMLRRTTNVLPCLVRRSHLWMLPPLGLADSLAGGMDRAGAAAGASVLRVWG